MNIFKKAHENTRKILKEGDDYRATFTLCLKELYRIERELNECKCLDELTYDKEVIKELNTFLRVNNKSVDYLFTEVDGTMFYNYIPLGEHSIYEYIKYRYNDNYYIRYTVNHIDNRVITNIRISMYKKGMVI